MSHPRTILVVDDEESMRHFLGKALQREGYRVITAADGPDAIHAAQNDPPDLALVDIRMPGMDGVALMRTLRSALPHLPVILMTAFGSVQNALHAMKYGAADYLTKPFRVDEIRAKVAKTLGGEAGPPPTLRAADTESASHARLDSVERQVPLPAPQGDGVLGASGALEPPPRGVLAFLRERAEEQDLPLDGIAREATGLREVSRLCELVYVDELFHLTAGNVSRAAEIAGITRPNLHRKAVDLGLSPDTYRRRSHEE
jgi:DNA-binding NtrC family response regulator